MSLVTELNARIKALITEGGEFEGYTFYENPMEKIDEFPAIATKRTRSLVKAFSNGQMSVYGYEVILIAFDLLENHSDDLDVLYDSLEKNILDMADRIGLRTKDEAIEYDDVSFKGSKEGATASIKIEI